MVHDLRRGGPTGGDGPTVSVVVPFYNEMHRIAATLPDIVGLATAEVEVVLVDDGSTDGTATVLRSATVGLEYVQLVQLPANQGKGAAVRAGVARTTGRRVVFMDADLAADLGDLPLLLAALDGAEVAIGSRSVAAAELRQATRLRSLMGSAFNRAVRSATGLEFLDTQCGFKAFRGDIARCLFAHARVDGFAFDVEVLVLAQRSGLRVVEVPVRWTEVRGSTVRFGIDPLRMLYDLTRIRRRATRTASAVMRELHLSAAVNADSEALPSAPHPGVRPVS